MNRPVRFTSCGNAHHYDLIIHMASQNKYGKDCTFEVCGPLIRDYSVLRYCISGNARLTLDGKQYDVTPGSTYVLPTGSTALEEPTGDTVEYYSCVFIGIKTAQYFSSIGITPKNPFFPWNENDTVRASLEQTIDTIGNVVKMPENEFIACRAAYDIMETLRKCTAKFRTNPNHADYVSAALTFMDFNFANGITVSDVTEYLGINRSYFYKLFKQHTGISPKEHLIRLRIAKACELLKLESATVDIVSEAVGMDTTSFFRNFKRICGMTTSDYRRLFYPGSTMLL